MAVNTMQERDHDRHSQRGWTFIEATIGVVLASIIVLGLAVTMMAMRETVDQSMAVRLMDQYGNDMMAHFQNAFETASSFVPIASQSSGQMDHFELHYVDPFTTVDVIHRYQATREQGIKRDNQRLDPQFPPNQMPHGRAFGVLGPHESFAIIRFTAVEAPRQGNSESFSDGSIPITHTIRYTKESVDPGQSDYVRDMTYDTLCFMKNRYVDNGPSIP